MFKKPQDNERYRWTSHIVRKMAYYRLTPSRVIRIVRAPERVEGGVAPGTLAGMQRTGSAARPSEIWAMWREEGEHPRRVIITAWRYPGVSPVRDFAPVPDEVLSELRSEGLLD